MLIKAITLFRLRAVSDFVFVFCSLINIEEAPISNDKSRLMIMNVGGKAK